MGVEDRILAFHISCSSNFRFLFLIVYCLTWPRVQSAGPWGRMYLSVQWVVFAAFLLPPSHEALPEGKDQDHCKAFASVSGELSVLCSHVPVYRLFPCSLFPTAETGLLQPVPLELVASLGC